jgi:hypothetical protein
MGLGLGRNSALVSSADPRVRQFFRPVQSHPTWDASATGVVVGAEETHQTKRWSSGNEAGGSQDTVTPLVWTRGKLQPLEMPPLVFHGVSRWSSAISRGGESVAVVVGGNLPDTLRSQVFQPSDGMWRPVGIRCETPVT